MIWDSCQQDLEAGSPDLDLLEIVCEMPLGHHFHVRESQVVMEHPWVRKPVDHCERKSPSCLVIVPHRVAQS